MGAAIKLVGVHKRFGATVALGGVSFEAAAGEVVALVGENGAGKSTLMNVLAGGLTPDEGRIEIGGRVVRFGSASDARAAGVALIHQELSLFSQLNVTENILMGGESARLGVVDRARGRARAVAVLERFAHPALRPEARVGDLPIGAQQIVEICRALAANARVLLMDEPTSSLDAGDVERLFGLIASLKSEGVCVVYISHFLEEVRRVADRAVVLRDGKDVGGGRLDAITDADLVAQMVGRRVDELYPPRAARRAGARVLSVRDLSAPPGLVRASLDVHAGEIVGIAGLVGSGRTEFLRALMGLGPKAAGVVVRGERPVGAATPAARLAAGFGFLSEDRKGEGLCLSMSNADNLTLTSLKPLARAGVLDLRSQSEAARSQLNELAVKTRGPAERTGALSGGNQQKIALGRLLTQDAAILLLDEPTRGVDIGSKAQLYQAIVAAASRGKAVIVTSSYLPELFGLCDRLAVMCRGVLSPARPTGDWTPETVMRAAIGSAAEAA